VEPVLLRIQESAKLLKVSKWTIYRWIEEGRLRATKTGQVVAHSSPDLPEESEVASFRLLGPSG